MAACKDSTQKPLPVMNENIYTEITMENNAHMSLTVTRDQIYSEQTFQDNVQIPLPVMNDHIYSDLTTDYKSESFVRSDRAANKKNIRRNYVIALIVLIIIIVILSSILILQNVEQEHGETVQRNIISKCTVTDCYDYYQRRMTTSGVYTIHPFGDNSPPVQVYCDMDTSGGGWTVIQLRHDGSVDFSRNWTEYKEGFGSVSNEYWIGNDVIHQMTKNNDTRIYFSITLTNGSTLYQEYDRFSISDESDGYRLFLSKPTNGSLGDRLVDTGISANNVVGMKFSTIGLHECVSGFGAGGGWWYNDCHDAYLNGPYNSKKWKQPWDPPIQNGIEVSRTKMMIRKC